MKFPIPIDVLFEKYHKWQIKEYPVPYSLDNGQMEDFSLAGIKTRIDKCVEFNEKIKEIKPDDSTYENYKNRFEVGGQESKSC